VLQAVGVTADSLVPHFNFDDMHRISASLFTTEVPFSLQPASRKFLEKRAWSCLRLRVRAVGE
jgi:hypothetical protein